MGINKNVERKTRSLTFIVTINLTFLLPCLFKFVFHIQKQIMWVAKKVRYAKFRQCVTQLLLTLGQSEQIVLHVLWSPLLLCYVNCVLRNISNLRQNCFQITLHTFLYNEVIQFNLYINISLYLLYVTWTKFWIQL